MVQGDEMKVAFLLLYSSMALFRASSQSFLSFKSLALSVQLLTLELMLNSVWKSSD